MQCLRPHKLHSAVRYQSASVALALHQKALALLSRTQSAVSEELAETLWENSVLDDVQRDLAATPTTARVTIYNVGERDVLSALLDHPFAPRDATLSQRWQERPDIDKLVIQHGEPSSTPSTLTGKWDYLTSFPHPIQITEVVQGPRCSSDIPIILDDPFTDPTASHHHPNTIFLSTESSQALPSLNEPGPHSLTVNPDRQLWANALLRDNPASSLAIQLYREASEESKIGEITRLITSILTSTLNLQSLRAQTALSDIRSVLYECLEALEQSSHSVNVLLEKASVLRDDIEQARARLHLDVLVGPKGTQIVPQALEQATHSMAQTMNRLTWWRAMWKVDELGILITEAVDRAWCKDLERVLIMHTGRLSAAQSQLQTYTHTLLDTSSALLTNALHQTSTALSYPLTSSSLTTPLHARKHQIIYPTTRLHLAAQKAVVGAATGISSGLGVAGAGWAGLFHVPHVLTPLLGSGMGFETAAGVGMLGAAVGIRWGVGKWEKAKKRWWEDWMRVGQGMERDITLRLDEVFTTQVALVPEQAISGLKVLAEKRLTPVQQTKDDVQALISELNQSLHPQS